MNRRLTYTAAPLALALLLGGCSGDGSATPETVTVTADGSGDGTADNATDAATEDDDSTPATADDRASDEGAADTAANGVDATGVDPNNPPAPIGEIIVPRNGEHIKDAKVELLKLDTWEDELTVAVVRVTPQPYEGRSDSSREFDAVTILGEAWVPQIVDLNDMLKYSAVTELRSNQWATKTTMGEPMYLWAAFPRVPSGNPINFQPSSLGSYIEGLTAP